LREKYPKVSEYLIRNFSNRNLSELKSVIKSIRKEMIKKKVLNRPEAKELFDILKEIVEDIAKIFVIDKNIINKLLSV
jgi:hypothetical protein